MIKKHVELGGTLDSTASRSMPTSPLGLLSLPCLHTQTGGQLRVPLYVIKGCSRSSMTKPHYFEVGLKMTRVSPTGCRGRTMYETLSEKKGAV
jgi:hypothetical protein